jgi:hypothetical protein
MEWFLTAPAVHPIVEMGIWEAVAWEFAQVWAGGNRNRRRRKAAGVAEQQRARSAKQTSEGSGATTAVASMSTPIFDELLREMAAQRGQAKAAADRHAAALENKHHAS